MERVVVISDIQYPYHDSRALKNVIRFIGEYNPDRVIQIGDALDYPTPSRWSKGTREEYAQLVEEHSKGFQEDVLKPLREVYDGPVGFLVGNHDERPMVYLTKEAPALAEFKEIFHVKTLCNFAEYDIEVISPFTKISADTVVIHGHEIKGSSQIAGTWAYNHAVKSGSNVVMGHTHRLGIRRHTFGNASTGYTVRWGFEVGHLMDPAKAQYLGPGAVANWQKGFGVLYVGQKDVAPVAVDVLRDGSFVVEGVRYGALKRGPGGRFAKSK